MQGSVVDYAFEGEFATFNVSLDLNEVVSILLEAADFRSIKNCSDPDKSLAKFGVIVSADYSPAGGQSERFENAGVESGGGREVSNGDDVMVGDRQTGGGQALAREFLIDCGQGGAGGMKRDAESFGGEGGNPGLEVTETYYTIDFQAGERGD